MSPCLTEPSFLPWAPSSDDPRVQRDIFPLRTCLKTPLNLSKGCHATQRKQLRRHNFDTESCFTVEALNACYAGKGLSGNYTSSNHPMPIVQSHDAPSYGISAAQASVLLHVSHSVESLGPPPSGPFCLRSSSRASGLRTLPATVLLAIPQAWCLCLIPLTPLYPCRSSGILDRCPPVGPLLLIAFRSTRFCQALSRPKNSKPLETLNRTPTPSSDNLVSMPAFYKNSTRAV